MNSALIGLFVFIVISVTALVVMFYIYNKDMKMKKENDKIAYKMFSDIIDKFNYQMFYDIPEDRVMF